MRQWSKVIIVLVIIAASHAIAFQVGYGFGSGDAANKLGPGSRPGEVSIPASAAVREMIRVSNAQTKPAT